MIRDILTFIHSSKVAFLIACVFVGALLGSVGGVLAYWMTLLITPDVTDRQLKVIIPAFTILGAVIGLYVPLSDFKSRPRGKLR